MAERREQPICELVPNLGQQGSQQSAEMAILLPYHAIGQQVGSPLFWQDMHATNTPSSVRFYNAHETSAVDDFAIALVCGEADFKVRFSLPLIHTQCVGAAALISVDVLGRNRDRRQSSPILPR